MTSYKNGAFLLTIIFLVCYLSGCGFELRGRQSLPLWIAPVAIVPNKVDDALVNVIKKQFAQSDIDMTSPDKARYILVLEKTDLERNIISIAASNGPRQYELIYHLFYQLTDAKSKKITPHLSVQAIRLFTENSNALLGSEYEQRLYLKALQQQTAQRLIQKLNADKRRFLPPT